MQGANGYNNAVKLLNDACDALYSTTKNGTKVVDARSINIEDFEGKFLDNNTRVGGVLTDAAITKRDAYNNSNNIKYGYRYTTENSTYRDSSGNYTKYKNYPLIYGLESDSIIDGESTDGILGLSSQTSFIERLDANLVAVAEKVTNSTSIRPKQTYYNLGSSFDSSYKSYFKNYENNETKSYADLLSPQGSSTNYWVASHCVDLYDDCCCFYVRNVNSGFLNDSFLYNSLGQSLRDSRGLFSVVSLSSELISPDTQNAGQFKVE